MPNLSLFVSRCLLVSGVFVVVAASSAGCATETNNARGAVPTAAVYNRPAVSGQALKPDRPIGDGVPDTELRADDLKARPASTRTTAPQPFHDADDFTVVMVSQHTIKFSHIFRMIEDQLRIQAAGASPAEFDVIAAKMFRPAVESEIDALLVFDDGWNALRPEQREQVDNLVKLEVKRLTEEAGGRVRWTEQLRAHKKTPEQVRIEILRAKVTKFATDRIQIKVTVRPDEILAGYDKIKEQHTIPGGVKFRVIEIEKNSGRGKPLPGKADASPLEVRDHIQLRLKEGDDFGDLAKKYSDFKAAQGGIWDDTRFIQEDSLKQRSWTEALAKLKTGQCTVNPIEGDNGNSWYFFKVDQRVGVTYKSAAELEDVIRVKIAEEKFDAERDAYLKNLRNKAWISRRDEGRILAAIRKQIFK